MHVAFVKEADIDTALGHFVKQNFVNLCELKVGIAKQSNFFVFQLDGCRSAFEVKASGNFFGGGVNRIFTSTMLGSQTVSKDGIGFNNQVRECDNSPMNVTQNVPLQTYNSFGIVAKAYSLVRIRSEADALEVQEHLKNSQEEHCVLGAAATLF